VEGVVTSWKKMPSFFSGAGFLLAGEEEGSEEEEEAATARGLPGTASGLSTTPGTSALTVTSAFLAPGSSCGSALAIAPFTKAASCAGLDAATAGFEFAFLPLSEFIEAASRVAAEDMLS
jgi:hypothetical protein